MILNYFHINLDNMLWKKIYIIHLVHFILRVFINPLMSISKNTGHIDILRLTLEVWNSGGMPYQREHSIISTKWQKNYRLLHYYLTFLRVNHMKISELTLNPVPYAPIYLVVRGDQFCQGGDVRPRRAWTRWKWVAETRGACGQKWTHQFRLQV